MKRRLGYVMLNQEIQTGNVSINEEVILFTWLRGVGWKPLIGAQLGTA